MVYIDFSKSKCYQKNQIFSLKILKECLKDRKDIRLILIGEGTDEISLKQYADENGLSEYIIWILPDDKIEKYYSAADVFLFPSIFEGLGIVALEAQVAGLPTLCSENIVNDVFLTNFIFRLQLDDMEEWRLKSKQLGNYGYDRGVTSCEGKIGVLNAGFSQKKTTKELLDLYYSL